MQPQEHHQDMASSSSSTLHAPRRSSEEMPFDDQDPEAWFHRAVVHHRHDENELAILELGKAIKLKPDFAQAWNCRGVAFFELKKYDDAIRDYDEAIRLDPKLAPAWFNRGDVFGALRCVGHTFQNYDKAVRLNPFHFQAWLNRGATYSACGRQDLAIFSLDEAVRLRPAEAVAFLSRGVVHERLGQLQKALCDFTEAIRLESDLQTAWDNRGRIYRRLGCHEEANRDLERASQRGPQKSAIFKSTVLSSASLLNHLEHDLSVPFGASLIMSYYAKEREELKEEGASESDRRHVLESADAMTRSGLCLVDEDELESKRLDDCGWTRNLSGGDGLIWTFDSFPCPSRFPPSAEFWNYVRLYILYEFLELLRNVNARSLYSKERCQEWKRQYLELSHRVQLRNSFVWMAWGILLGIGTSHMRKSENALALRSYKEAVSVIEREERFHQDDQVYLDFLKQKKEEARLGIATVEMEMSHFEIALTIFRSLTPSQLIQSQITNLVHQLGGSSLPHVETIEPESDMAAERDAHMSFHDQLEIIWKEKRYEDGLRFLSERIRNPLSSWARAMMDNDRLVRLEYLCRVHQFLTEETQRKFGSEFLVNELKFLESSLGEGSRQRLMIVKEALIRNRALEGTDEERIQLLRRIVSMEKENFLDHSQCEWNLAAAIYEIRGVDEESWELFRSSVTHRIEMGLKITDLKKRISFGRKTEHYLEAAVHMWVKAKVDLEDFEDIMEILSLVERRKSLSESGAEVSSTRHVGGWVVYYFCCRALVEENNEGERVMVLRLERMMVLRWVLLDGECLNFSSREVHLNVMNEKIEGLSSMIHISSWYLGRQMKGKGTCRDVPVAEEEGEEEEGEVDHSMSTARAQSRYVNHSLSNARKAIKEQLASLTSLYNDLIGGLEELIPEGASVTIIPDKILFQVPFACLLTIDENTKKRRYVIERWSLNISESLHASMINRKRLSEQEFPHPSRCEGSRELLCVAIGNLTYSGSTPPLPESAREIQLVDRLMNESAAEKKQQQQGCVCLQTDTTSVDVVRDTLKFRRPRYVHFSTHISSESDDVRGKDDFEWIFVKNTISGCAILSGSECLEARDIQSWECLSGVSLVFLNGCNSGGGRELFEEGVLGFSRALFRAGVPSVVCSQWEVDDTIALFVADEFYRGLLGEEGLNRGECLQAALVGRLLGGKRKRKCSKFQRLMRKLPVLWGGYQVNGCA